jgi:hypothetical protein
MARASRRDDDPKRRAQPVRATLERDRERGALGALAATCFYVYTVMQVPTGFRIAQTSAYLNPYCHSRRRSCCGAIPRIGRLRRVRFPLLLPNLLKYTASPRHMV